MHTPNPPACPKCGAIYQDDLTCQSVFDQFLALEFTNPDYGAVHFLTVACFMVQHGRYSAEGLVWIEDRLRDYLERDIPIAQIRQQASHETGQQNRDWKITRRPTDPPQPRIPWSMNIIDVALAYQDAGSYREQIEQWARATLQEMQPLLPLD